MLKEGSTALPWSGSTSIASGLAAKKNTTLEELCLGCPAGMLEYMKAVRSMGYEDVPKYDKLDAMLESMENAAAAAGRGGARGVGRSTVSKGKPKAIASDKSASGKGKTASAAAKRTAKGKSATKAVASEEDEDDEGEEEGEEEEVEVCDVKAKGKGRAAKIQRGSAAVAKGSSAPASPKHRTTVRRSRRLSSPKDGEEFFDALQEHDSNKEEEGDEELEVTKVVRGGAKRTAGGAGKKGASPKGAAIPKGVFVVEVRGASCVRGEGGEASLEMSKVFAVVGTWNNAADEGDPLPLLERLTYRDVPSICSYRSAGARFHTHFFLFSFRRWHARYLGS